MITDPISDMLTRIRNASLVRKDEVVMPFSKMKLAIAKILSQEGFVSGFDKLDSGYGQLKISLKYVNGESLIRAIHRVSKPGHRVYKASVDLPRVLSDQGIAIVSTSQGVMSNKEARKRKLGGEVLAEIY